MPRLPKGFLTYSSILHSHALHGIQKTICCYSFHQNKKPPTAASVILITIGGLELVVASVL